MYQQSGYTPHLHWAVTSHQLAGESVSGDRGVVEETGRGTLMAVIDGLGHGQEASEAAASVREALVEQAEYYQGMDEMFEHCHWACKSSRGVVMSAAWYERETGCIEWSGVGDVTAVIYSRSGGQPTCNHLITSRGILGYRLPKIRIERHSFEPQQWLVLATDGINEEFSSDHQTLRASNSPLEKTNAIVKGFSDNTDDALVLATTRRGASV